MNLKNKRIYIAGAGGMVGGAIKKRLEYSGCTNLICPASKELDLVDQKQVENFFSREKPEVVILAAAKVGGILANDSYRAEFIYENLMIEANVIHAAYRHDAEKLVFLGSSCIYPKLAAQPIKEEYLLEGCLEPTNEPYAIAKIAGIKLCENYYRQFGCNFFSVMPTNLYGPGDNFDLQTSHVVPALIRKFHEAKTSRSPQVKLWGTGMPRREFLYVADLAEAVVFLLESINAGNIYEAGLSKINIGTGVDIEIKELAAMVKKVVNVEAEIEYDETKPDGTPRKLLDVSRINQLGWKYQTLKKIRAKTDYEKSSYHRHYRTGRKLFDRDSFGKRLRSSRHHQAFQFI